MNQALEKAIKLNRKIERLNTFYDFKIASSQEEEEKILLEKENKTFLTILRLYEPEIGNENNLDFL